MRQIVSLNNKEKFKLNSINTRKLLGVFLREPEKHFTYKDIRKILLDTSESHIRATLSGLERLRTLEAKGLRGRPKGGDRLKEYSIFIDLDTFKKIFYIYLNLNDEIEGFLKSNYVNILIKKFGFLEIYRVIKAHLERTEFRRKASSALLGQQALAEEYIKYKEFIRRDLESSYYQTVLPNIRDDPKVFVYPPMPKYDLFEPLSNLNLLDSINFYRKNLNSTYIRFYRHLIGDYIDKSMKKYVDLDIYLSPLTSYPVNDPVHLLFAKPFERLHDDIYIFEDADYYKMIKRAYIVYSHFPEILYSGTNYLKNEMVDRLDWDIKKIYFEMDTSDLSHDEKQDLSSDISSISKKMDSIWNIDRSIETLLKINIFYWNASSRRLDILFKELTRLRKNNSNKYYHILSDNKGLRIFDLETNCCIISQDTKKESIDPYFLLEISSDPLTNPFSVLRPCNIFYDERLKLKEQTYDGILAELRLKLD
ncbi:MAG: hypothetical protein PHY05_04380 [Methanothrix sp.]|nr:hypothetical protein [Methanothrix sp.]